MPAGTEIQRPHKPQKAVFRLLPPPLEKPLVMSTKKTVIYLVPSLIKSGPINVVLDIARHLDRTRFRPVVVALQRHRLEKERGNRADFEREGIDVVEYAHSYWHLQLHARGIARGLRREFSADAVFHGHGYYPTLVLSHLRDRHTMVTVHNICDEDFRLRSGALMGRYMAATYKRALRRIGLCVTICRTMQDFYARDPHLRLCTIYNGVQVPDALVPANKRTEARRQLDIPSNTCVLLYPASFNPRKNHAALIDALRGSGDDFIVLMAGMGDTLDECRRLAAGDARFRFLGYRKDMETPWAAADFMVSPSRSEGLPLAVLEAAVRGLPCLLSDIPPHAEIARNLFGDEAGTLLFALESPDRLRRTIEANLSRTFDREAIRTRAIPLYGAQAMADGYMRLYAGTAAERV